MSDEATVTVRFKGPEDEVIIDRTGQVVKQGETVEVSESVAHGQKQSGADPNELSYRPALGGLLDQEDKWELAEKARAKPAAKAAEEGDA